MFSKNHQQGRTLNMKGKLGEKNLIIDYFFFSTIYFCLNSNSDLNLSTFFFFSYFNILQLFLKLLVSVRLLGDSTNMHYQFHLEECTCLQFCIKVCLSSTIINCVKYRLGKIFSQVKKCFKLFVFTESKNPNL